MSDVQLYSGYDAPMDKLKPLSEYPPQIVALAEICEDALDADWSFDGRYDKAGEEENRQYAIRQIAHFMMLAKETQP